MLALFVKIPTIHTYIHTIIVKNATHFSHFTVKE